MKLSLITVVALASLSGAVLANQSTILVPLDSEPSWKDMAFLAATTASEQTNRGKGSLVALEKNGKVGPEIRDYLLRYRPKSVYLLADQAISLDFKNIVGLKNVLVRSIRANSAEEASLSLSKEFWKVNKTAVLCRSDDYDSALLGSSVAGLLDAPLIYFKTVQSLLLVEKELKRLGVIRAISIGPKLSRLRRAVIHLNSSTQVMKWVREKGPRVTYLAAVNSTDRNASATRKLSLIGAQLAVGRRGLVAPLNVQVQWKRPFKTEGFAGQLPAGVPRSTKVVKRGEFNIEGESVPFFLTGENEEFGLRLSVDTQKDGRFSSSLVSGDLIELSGKRYALSLGTRTKFGKTDVHLTWPTAADFRDKLEQYYQALGRHPEHLCLVGFPDVLPHAIYGRGGIVEEHVSDLPYAIAGAEEFASIGVGRVIAENVSFGSLFAARSLTYNDLLEPTWSVKAGQAEWENTLAPLFTNVGFDMPYQFKESEILARIPTEGPQKGIAPASFSQDSPLARTAVVAHSQHSDWSGLGSMFKWDAEVLLAPTVIESGGCGTACLDREADNRSVVARLLRLGAVAFSGGSRELSAEAQPLRMEFWNGLLAGKTLGQSHVRALNAGLSVIKDRREGPEGAYRYNTSVRMQFGDPGLSIRLPSKPITEPSKTIIDGNRVSVFAPQKWSVIKSYVPADWKDWGTRDLFVVRGPGSFAMSSWSGQGRDVEIPLVLAEFTTTQKVKSIVQEKSLPSSLGWNGRWFTNVNSNGTYTHRFLVRIVDFDQTTGKIGLAPTRLDYRLTFEER